MKSLTPPKMLLSLLVLMFTAQSVQAVCNNSVPATTPDSDFTLHNDGTVTHNTTGLMWMRCSLGQSWDGSTCSGSPRAYTWANALSAAQSHEFAGYSDWRLPNKNELESIVEERCVSPAINTDIFPGAPSGWFWSSSPYVGWSYGAWDVDFGFGGSVHNVNKDYGNGVRLVRAVQTSGPDDGTGPDPRPGSKASVNLNNLSGHMLLLYSASKKAYAATHFDEQNDLFYVAAGISSQTQEGSAADSEGEWTVAQNKLTLSVVERTPMTITADEDGSFRLGKTYQSTQGEWSVVDIYSQDEWAISDVTGYKFYFLTASSIPAETLTQIVFYPNNKLTINGRELKWRYTQGRIIEASDDGGASWNVWSLFYHYSGWTFGQEHNNPLQTYFIKIEPVAVDE